MKSQLGIQELQPAASSALAMAHTRKTGVIAAPAALSLPGADHTGRAFAVQPKLRIMAGRFIAGSLAKSLRFQSL
jgi:hypothetical protein